MGRVRRLCNLVTLVKVWSGLTIVSALVLQGDLKKSYSCRGQTGSHEMTVPVR